MKSVFSKF